MTIQSLSASVIMAALKDAADGDNESLLWLNSENSFCWWFFSGQSEPPSLEKLSKIISDWKTNIHKARSRITQERIELSEWGRMNYESVTRKPTG